MSSGQPSHYIVGVGSPSVILPNGASLRRTTFTRRRDDLWLVGATAPTVIVRGFFATDTPPALESADGSIVGGDLVRTLAGLSHRATTAMAPGNEES